MTRESQLTRVPSYFDLAPDLLRNLRTTVIHGVLEIGIFCQRTCRFLKHLHVVQFRNWGSKVPLDFYKPISTRPHDDYGFTDPPLSVHKLHEAVLNLDIVKG